MSEAKLPSLPVAVIGVGSVGLTAIHWCLERGLEVVAFEQREGCGGIWRQDEPGPAAHSPAYDSLFTNSSKTLMNLSDFEFDVKTKTAFPAHQDILKYFESYERQFDLGKHVVWGAHVHNVRKDDGIWTVRARDARTGAELGPRQFSAILVCTGKLWDQQLPEWAATPRQGGPKVLHAKAYRNPEPFRGKPVMVLGVGNSALDIALELSKDPAVPAVYLSCRRGTTVIPTQDSQGNPTDCKLATRAFQYGAPRWARIAYLLWLVTDVNKAFAASGMPSPPGGLFARESPTANLKQTSEFLAQLANGRIKVVAAYDGSDKLADGSPVPSGVGAVICCTGYTLRLDRIFQRDLVDKVQRRASWGDRSVNWLALYKHIMLPGDPSCHFLGFITSFGNETVIGEMQARWATAVIAGILPPPSDRAVQEDVKRTAAFLDKTRPSVSGFVRYVPYMDSLAADLGCRPPAFRDLLADPRLAYDLYMKPVTAVQFRLRGPDALPEQSRAFLSRL